MILENDLNVLILLFSLVSQFQCNFNRLSGTMISCLNRFHLKIYFVLTLLLIMYLYIKKIFSMIKRNGEI